VSIVSLTPPVTAATTEAQVGIWPPFPIVIQTGAHDRVKITFIGALEHNNRVCKIELEVQWVPSSLLENFEATKQQPFPGR